MLLFENVGLREEFTIKTETSEVMVFGFRGTVWGVVERCESLRNGCCGIRLSDAAQPTLEGNTCRENGLSGIAYFGSAAGTARNNTCEKNSLHGIYVDVRAGPTDARGKHLSGKRRLWHCLLWQCRGHGAE
jgi:parallel beta-helix repeat protein